MIFTPVSRGIVNLVCTLQTLSVYKLAVTILAVSRGLTGINAMTFRQDFALCPQFDGLQVSSSVILTHCAYNLFFHPLRSYPGPLLWRAARLPYVLRALQGRLAYDLLDLHERYGPVIRIAPNELALAYEGVWEEIHGGTYENEMEKWKPYYRVQHDQTGFIFTAPADEHSKMRRALSYGFSDRGIRDVESRMISMLDKMMDRLFDICSGRGPSTGRHPVEEGAQICGTVVDIAQWCNFLTFDMIGELVFGESYKCLETATYHPWVKPVVELTHYSGILANLGFYPTFQDLLLKIFGSLICRRMEFHQKHSRAALERRAAKSGQSDLLSEPLKQTQASLDVSETFYYPIRTHSIGSR